MKELQIESTDEYGKCEAIPRSKGSVVPMSAKQLQIMNNPSHGWMTQFARKQALARLDKQADNRLSLQAREVKRLERLVEHPNT